MGTRSSTSSQRPGLPRALAPGRADPRPQRRSRRRAACARAPTCSPTPTRPTSCSSPPGAEVSTALGARDLLAEKGVQVRVVSMPSWELFEQQERRVPRRGAAARRAEDLGRGRARRSAGRAGSTPRSASTASARRARATRCSRTSASARRPSRSASKRRSPSSPSRSEGPRRLHPGRGGRGPARHRDRRAARDVDDVPGVRVGLRARRLRRRGRRRARARRRRRRARGRAAQRPDRGLRLRQLAARVPRARRRTRRSS